MSQPTPVRFPAPPEPVAEPDQPAAAAPARLDREAGAGVLDAATKALPRPTRVVAVAAVPPAPGPPPTEPPLDDPAESPAPATWRTRAHRRLRRLQVGQHTAAPAALDRLQVTSGTFGLRLGRDQRGGPVAITLFRPEPMRVVLIGGPWAAELLTFRALGFGARAVIFAADARGWIELGKRATGRTDRVAVLSFGSPVSMTASSDAPMLQLGGPEPGGERGLPAWTTRLSVLWQATEDQNALIAGADLILAQRLGPAEAEALAAIRRLPAASASTLQVLPDDMLAVISDAATRYVWVEPTGAERELLGAPHRF